MSFILMLYLNGERTLPIVKNGRANAIIIIPPDAEKQTIQAANVLAEYVKKATKATLLVKSGKELSKSEQVMNHILVGYTGNVPDRKILNGLQEMDDDGFVIITENKKITIVGPTTWGTQYGVFEFLERYVGVSWLLPGPNGEDVPESQNLSIPFGMVKQEPAYLSRVLYGLDTKIFLDQDNSLSYLWGERNRLHQRISGYHHNLWRLFLPAKGTSTENYPITNPEFYPLRNGNRFIPDSQTNWQPCFSEPSTIKTAIDSITDYFKLHPEETTFSLAINDNGGFCEEEPDHPNNPLRKNSIGEPDMSHIYYAWVNKVVEGVLKQYPDKWFGLLAYGAVNDPPSFKLNPRVIPYFTKDRMSWIDSQVRTKDQNAIEAWTEVTQQMAYYDYVYGSFYSIPRFYPHQLSEYLKYGNEHGVIAYFGELMPNWGEGPKAWILAKLLWNPNQDVDKLLQFWYERAVGVDAAPYLESYYDLWEQFWTTRIKDTPWFQKGKDMTYLNFNDKSYLEAVSQQYLKESRILLELVIEKTKTPQEKSRAALILKEYENYEVLVRSYTTNSDSK